MIESPRQRKKGRKRKGERKKERKGGTKIEKGEER